MGEGALLRQAITGPIKAAVFTEDYLVGEETGEGTFINCFWIAVGPAKDFT